MSAHRQYLHSRASTAHCRPRQRRELVARWFFALYSGFAAACGPRPPINEPPSHSDPIAEVPSEELYRRGLARAQQGDLGRAEQYIAAALSKGHPHQQALPMLLRVCVAANRYRHALTYARTYMERFPDDWSLRYLVATIQMAMGDEDEARTELAKVIRQAPDRPGPHFLMAELLRERQPDDAQNHYQRYLELAEDGPNAAAAREALQIMKELDPASSLPLVPSPEPGATNPSSQRGPARVPFETLDAAAAPAAPPQPQPRPESQAAPGATP